MGLFSGLKDALFGDGGEGAANRQAEDNRENRLFIQQQAEAARSDGIPLFDAAMANRQAGAESALDAIFSGVGEQLSALQQGNQGAQQALLAGMPNYQAAILGTPMSGDFYQPSNINTDTSFLRLSTPGYSSVSDALDLNEPEQVAPQIDWSRYLNGFNWY